MTSLAITPGEPAGIGPDIVLALWQRGLLSDCVIVASPALLDARARLLGYTVDIVEVDDKAAPGRALSVHAVPLAVDAVAGQLDPRNAAYVLETLAVATDGCVTGRFTGLVTGPVHKGVINDAGVPFTGHTEWLAERTQTPQVVMMLTAEDLRVALVTTHLPITAVPAAITADHLERVIRITVDALTNRFGITTPRVMVLGLNPHAGEGGHMGDEEIRIIIPVLQKLRSEGFDLTGPLPADTAFALPTLGDYDTVLAMYHDQGLPVVKFKGFGGVVNVTLGLPIVRTSVDHGTAVDIAGNGTADPGSLLTAIACARRLLR